MSQGIVPVVFGTTGHVDHGKSTLVRELTGIDPDRLAEEKTRGLTIDLGFAPFRLDDGRQISVIDVPGHERFVKNAVAGVAGLDLVLLVVAADDGVMPQTLEHLDAILGFGVRRLIGVVTKVDLVDEDTAELACEELRELLAPTPYAEAPIVRCSVPAKIGLDEVRSAITEQALSIEPRSADGPFRVCLQRVFSLDGIGTVVTGIPDDGQLKVGEELVAWPSGRRVRVRGLHAFGSNRDKARAGHSTALSVPDAKDLGLSRGSVLAAPDAVTVGDRLDLDLSLSTRAHELRHRDRVRVHVGTGEVQGTAVVPEQRVLRAGDEALVRILLDEPIAGVVGQPVLLRLQTPPLVLGGGKVLAIGSGRGERRRRRIAEKLHALAEAGSDVAARTLAEVQAAGLAGVPAADLAGRLGVSEQILEQTVEQDQRLAFHPRGRRVLESAAVTETGERVLGRLKQEVRRSGAASCALSDLRSQVGRPHPLFDAAVDALIEAGELRHAEGGRVLSPDALAPLAEAEQKDYDALLEGLHASGFRPPKVAELPEALGLPEARVQRAVARALDLGSVLRAGDFFWPQSRVDQALRMLRDHALQRDGAVELPAFRDQLDTSRKWLLPLMEIFDGMGLTRLRGAERRYLSKSSAAEALEKRLASEADQGGPDGASVQS